MTRINTASLTDHLRCLLPVAYAAGENGLTTARPSDMEFPGVSGGLCSTVEDLLVWQRALVTGDVVGAESYDA